MMRRLYLQIYLSFVLMLVIAVVAGGLAGRFIHGQRAMPEPVANALARVVKDLRLAEPEACARFGRETGLSVLLTEQGTELARVGDLRPVRDESSTWHWARGGPVLAYAVDGRVLQLGVPLHDRPDGTFMLALLAVAGATGLGAWPVARGITRRLEALRSGVAAWGDGALSRRVPVEGQDEVAALAEAFNGAADQVAALVDGQRRMLASASHELRSPLARLRMALELIEAPDAAPHVAQAVREVEELDQLIGDLLLTTRAQAVGRLTGAPPVDLGALARAEAQRVGARVVGDGSTPGDTAMIRRALRNLLENARRHGGPEVCVVIEGATVSVEDDGPGVPAAEVERIWEPFYRPQGHRESEGGVGLGLALVREIARVHGGHAGYTPRPGGGSGFWIRLAPVGAGPVG